MVPRLLVAMFGLVLLVNPGCDFKPALPESETLPECSVDDDCIGGCICFDGQVCAPIDPDATCERECDTDEDCSLESAEGRCVRGRCEHPDCVAGRADCDGDEENGCETDLTSDLAHCGGCDQACWFPNAGASCEQEGCVMGPCNTGHVDCNLDPLDGCEILLGTIDNCQTCGDVCQINQRCVVGECGCQAGWGNCDWDESNGCETSLDTDGDCGSCGNSCGDRQRCETDSCVCAEGWADCDGNGECETQLGQLNNCGACGDVCERANALSGCLGGTCVLDQCMDGFENCDGDDSNGCETPVAYSSTDCGVCGVPCDPAMGMACNEGTCAWSPCGDGWANCGQGATGCLTQLGTMSNCAFCGDVCNLPHVDEQCHNGACEMVGSCNVGWEDCDGEDATGCETPLGTLTDCTVCGETCTPAHGVGACDPDGCVIASCNGGWADCNDDLSDGCETNMGVANFDCGQCGDLCPVNQVCVDDACVPSSVTCSGVACRPGEVCCEQAGVLVCIDSLNSDQCGQVFGCTASADCLQEGLVCCQSAADGEYKCIKQFECVPQTMLCSLDDDCLPGMYCCGLQQEYGYCTFGLCQD